MNDKGPKPGHGQPHHGGDDDDRHGSSTDRALRQLVKSTDHVANEITALAKAVTPRPHLGGFVGAIHGRRRTTTMPVNIPVPKLLDVEEIDLSIMPRKADGTVDLNVSPTWKGSDQAIEVKPGYYRLVAGSTDQYELTTDPFAFMDPVSGAEVMVPGNYNCVAPTPGPSGSYSVECGASGFDSNVFGPVTWEAGQPRQLNGSVGTPRAEYGGANVSRTRAANTARRPSSGNAAN